VDSNVLRGSSKLSSRCQVVAKKCTVHYLPTAIETRACQQSSQRFANKLGLALSLFVLQVSIYVEKSALLWKAPDALELLRSAATAAADVAEGGSKKSGRVGEGGCTHRVWRWGMTRHA
jgi:hypothetical protein